MEDTAQGFVDDPNLDGNLRLFRRVRPGWVKQLEDGRLEPRSDVFQFQRAEVAESKGLPGPCMSLGSEEGLERHGYGPGEMVREDSDYGLVALTAEALRSLGFKLQLWPTDAEPWHVVAFCDERPKITQGQQKRLKRAAVWVIEPAGAL